MPQCTRNGCGKEFDQSSTESCLHHSGAPIFHEGLKSWSCCNDVNKPVMEFEEFMKLSGCTEADRHTDEAANPVAPRPSTSTSFTKLDTESEKEVYASFANLSIPSPAPPAIAVVEDEDDLSVAVAPGTMCRRTGCKTVFVTNSLNRQGDGEGATCTYHPAPPIFREGSKGYLCCKRRVLEFDEFLKITGCTTGKHLFSPTKTTPVTEEAIACRVDHYQTIDQVHVSVFAKQADKARSVIKIEDTQVTLDICLPGQKRFSRVLDLFGPIDPAESSYQFFGTKVELHLHKHDGRSWPLLEKTTHDLGNISLTFGVGGKTGTVGAKEIVMDDANELKIL